jgi:hypothetical protein
MNISVFLQDDKKIEFTLKCPNCLGIHIVNLFNKQIQI